MPRCVLLCVPLLAFTSMPSAAELGAGCPSVVVVFCRVGGGGGPGLLGMGVLSLLACLLEIRGVCWKSALTGAGFGGVAFCSHLVSGDAMSGLVFLTNSGGIVIGVATDRVCFFSLESISFDCWA